MSAPAFTSPFGTPAPAPAPAAAEGASTTRTWEYRARDRSGRVVKGRMEAPSESALVARLRASGTTPLEMKEAGTGLNREITLPGQNRVKLKDLAVMARQLATMVESGLTLLRALSILAEQTTNPALAKILVAVRADVEQGLSLSGALAKHPRVFPPLMVNLTRAGEVGGFLDAALLSIAANFEAEMKLRAKVKSAMTYPVVVFVMAVIALIGMLTFIVPVFTSMFASLGGTMPLPTRILVLISSWMKFIVPIGAVLLVAVALAWSRWKDHPRLRGVVDPLRLRMPVFGPLAAKIAISRFSRNLGTMVRSGVPILQALEIVGATSGNVVIQRAVHDVQDSVRHGESMAAPLAEHKVFPSMVVQMLAVGEDTGAVDTMLEKLAAFYDTEVEATTEALTSLIEPLMIAVIGSMIGGMIIALYLPIFSIYNQIH